MYQSHKPEAESRRTAPPIWAARALKAVASMAVENHHLANVATIIEEAHSKSAVVAAVSMPALTASRSLRNSFQSCHLFDL